MLPANPLITIFDFAILIVLMRFWLQFGRADFYNPFSQAILKITRPVLTPFRQFVPSKGRIDWACLVVAYLLLLIITTLIYRDVVPITYLPIIAALGIIKSFGMLIFWALLLLAIMSWISQGRTPVEAVLTQLTEPYLRPIRNAMPDLGGLDLSLFVVVVALQVINYLLAVIIPSPLWLYA